MCALVCLFSGAAVLLWRLRGGADAGTNPGGCALTPSSTLFAPPEEMLKRLLIRRSGSHCRESFDPTREGRRAGDARLPSHRLMLLLPRVAQWRLWLQGASLSVVWVYLDDCVLSVKFRETDLFAINPSTSCRRFYS